MYKDKKLIDVREVGKNCTSRFTIPNMGMHCSETVFLSRTHIPNPQSYLILQMLSIRTDFTAELKFPFRKYANLIISVVPKTDIIGISEIIFTDYFSSDKCSNDCLGYYIPEQRGRDSIIGINIPNLLKKDIPKYLFDDYPEIAALFLSEILIHEIGHHVHHFKRHGVRKKKYEKFADKYARAGCYNYLILRRFEILFSYRWASWNIFRFDKDGRKKFSKNREELIRWMEENGNGIPFP